MLLEIVAVALVAGLAAGAGHGLVALTAGIGTMWLADGVVVAWLLCADIRTWPVGLAGGAGGMLAAALLCGVPAGQAIGLALVHVLDSAGTAWVLRHNLGRTPGLPELAPVRFRACAAAGLVPAAAGVAAAGVLDPFAGQNFATAWWTWSLANAVGMAVVVPPVLFLLRGAWMGTEPSWRSPLRALGLQAGLIVVVLGVFLQTSYPLLFLIPPVMLFVMSRLGGVGAMAFAPVLAGIALVCTALGLGPFGLNAAIAMPGRLITAQLFVLSGIALAHVMAALAVSRRRTLAALEDERARLAENEAVLAESMARYRLLAENASDMIVVADRPGARRYVSPSCRALLGYSPDELLAEPHVPIFHPGDAGKALAVVHGLLDGRETGADRHVYRVCHRDGRSMSVEVLFRVFRAPETGAPLQICASFRDIDAQVAAQTALREREAMFRLITESASDMVTRVGPDGLRRYVSPAAQQIFGVPPETLLAANMLDFVHADDRPAMLARIARQIDGESETERPTFRIRRPDGSVAWLEASSRLVQHPVTGAPDGYVAVLRDITARVTAERALRQSEERYAALLDGVTGEAVYLLDAEGRVESWNAGAEFIKGYTKAEIVGSNFAVFFTPEDVAGGAPMRMLAEARAQGSVTEEGWRMRKDGTRFRARVTVSAIRGEDGALRGYAKVTHDITRQWAEEAQRAIIIEAAPNGMLIVDEAGTITLANAQVERMFDYPRGGLTRKPIETLIHDGFRARHEELRSAFTSGRTDKAMSPQRVVIGRRRDGFEVSLEIMLSPVETPNGRIVVASVTDVSERLRREAARAAEELRDRLATQATNARLELLSQRLAEARDRAEQANEAKSKFLAAMSHELRTPLHGILGYADLLRLEGGLDAGQTERVTGMLAAGRHLLGLINTVLDLSQIEAGRMELQAERIDPAALARDVLDVVRPAAAEKQLALGLTVSANAPGALLADATRLRQVLVNLLGNAIKFTVTGRVELRLAAAAEGMLRLEVADSGPGISGRLRERLFGEFERMDNAAEAGIEGSGLGLAISARLVRRMGGRIGHADNPTGGSVFWAELPAGDAEAGATELPAPAASGQLRCLRILVADDLDMNRAVAGGMLRLAGHDVVMADGGAAAADAAAAADFDVILMDVQMPLVDGLEATRRIRALPDRRARTPILAVTAQAFAEQIEECRLAGMNGYIQKPFDRVTLLAAVAAAAQTGGGWSGGTAVADDDAGAPHGTVFDRKTFDAVVEGVAEDEIEEHLQTLASRTDALLGMLQVPRAPSQAIELVAAAHALAGGAGTWGFARLSAAARRFERAADSGTPEVDARAAELEHAAEATLAFMQHGAVEAAVP